MHFSARVSVSKNFIAPNQLIETTFINKPNIWENIGERY
jgi:hypothetical protein